MAAAPPRRVGGAGVPHGGVGRGAAPGWRAASRRAARFPVPPDNELPATPDEEITTRLDVTAHLPAKVAALRAHATQLTVVDGLSRTSR